MSTETMNAETKAAPEITRAAERYRLLPFVLLLCRKV